MNFKEKKIKFYEDSNFLHLNFSNTFLHPKKLHFLPNAMKDII